MYLYKQHSTSYIVLTSLSALLLGHMMITTNLLITFIGLLTSSYFVYFYTLRKNDIFSFIMVIYFTNHFNYFGGYGGGFNIVAFFATFFYILFKRTLPFELGFNQRLFNLFSFVFLISSILGWIYNFAGELHHLIVSILSFSGVILLLYISSRLVISKSRIKIFLKISIFLAFYSVLASINTLINILPVNSPMFPMRLSGNMSNVLDLGGVFGPSPIYGEHSMVMSILFGAFLMFSKGKYLTGRSLYFGLFFSILGVFFSASRSVFILTFIGFLLLFIFQYKLVGYNLKKQLKTLFGGIVFIAFVLIVILFTGADGVFSRLNDFENQYSSSGGEGLLIENIFDGSMLGRKESFDLGYERYFSKDNWFLGYGWGPSDINRYAFYTDTSVIQGTAHSQVFAMLFLFGWLGLFSYFSLYIISIYKSFVISGSNKFNCYDNRILALIFSFMFFLFVLNEIKVDSVSVQYYFGVTMILLGLSFANINNYEINCKK